MPEPADQTMKGDVSAPRTFASGRYVVQRVLPEGAQKTVYVVHGSALNRECALALIKTDQLRTGRCRTAVARSRGDGAHAWRARRWRHRQVPR